MTKKLVPIMDLLNLNIPTTDLFRVVLRPEIIGARDYMILAHNFARNVLPKLGAKYLDEANQLWDCLDTLQQHIEEDAVDESDLRAAGLKSAAIAITIAQDTDNSSISNVAYAVNAAITSATYPGNGTAAIHAAIYAAAATANIAIEQEWQLAHAKEILSAGEE